MIRKKDQTLSDKISNILNTAPTIIDPEDDADPNSQAQVVSNDGAESDSDNIAPDQSKSTIRKQNLELLENVDTRYAGKKGSRKSLQDSDESEDDDSTVESDQNSLEQSSHSESFDSDESSEGSESELSNTDNRDKIKDTSAFQHMKDTNVNLQLQKGNCVRNQLLLWESLLEMRIKLQKCLLTANQLPQSELYSTVCKDPQFDSSIAEQTKTSVSNILNNLLDLQDTLIQGHPETKVDATAEKNDDDDEEIPSDTENEDSKIEDNEKIEDNSEPPRKLQKLNEYEKIISKRHEQYKPWRNLTIRKWNEKTRISVAKNLINSNSVLNQIEYILKDREKCLKRTQTKRSNYQIVGVDQSVEQDSEIFDDTDFYHQLLRELIEFKSSDITDPVKLSRQWIQLQSLRSKMKRNVDTKATKGRKIRYTVHSKLVNFMAPIPNNQMTDSAKNELYNSLFGKFKK